MQQISYSHLMLPGLCLSKKYGGKLWRIGKDHLRDLDTKVAFQKSISTSYWKLLYPSKTWGIWRFFQKLSGFHKCGLYLFNPNVVYKKLPTENVMSPRKALDQSLLQQLQCIRESPVGEDAEQNKKRTWLDVAPGKSISNHDFVSRESESGFETKSEPESEPEESNIQENDAGQILVLEILPWWNTTILGQSSPT